VLSLDTISAFKSRYCVGARGARPQGFTHLYIWFIMGIWYDSFSGLHFPDGCVRPKFRQKLLDSGITPEQIAWLEEDADEEMEEWRRRKRRRGNRFVNA
jgi:hypothetical protein